MKKIYALMALAILAVSCDSFFDINLKDQATLEDTMSRSSTVKRYLAHLYSYIPRDENTRAYEGGTVLRSDESLNAKSQYETYWYTVRRGEYDASTTNSEANANVWKRYYVAINECTTFLDNVDQDKEDSPELINQMKGEARFLRAYYYFVLLRCSLLWQAQATALCQSEQTLSCCLLPIGTTTSSGRHGPGFTTRDRITENGTSVTQTTTWL